MKPATTPQPTTRTPQQDKTDVFWCATCQADVPGIDVTPHYRQGHALTFRRADTDPPRRAEVVKSA